MYSRFLGVAKQEWLLVSYEFGSFLCFLVCVSLEREAKMACRCRVSRDNLGGMFALWKLTAQTKDYFCMLNCANFYPFFILGVFTTKYKLLEKLKQTNWFFSLCVVGYLALFCVNMPIHALESLNHHIFLPFCMVTVVVSLFMARENASSCVERILEYVGKRTLDVYVIHYFFITHIHLSMVDKWLEDTNNVVLSLALSTFLAIIVTALSIGVGNILHKGKLIEKVAYGK